MIRTATNSTSQALVLLAVASTAANASDLDPSGEPRDSGFYGEVRGGAVFLDDSNNGQNGINTLGRTTNFDTGFTVSGAFGRDISRYLKGAFTSFRAEAEIAYGESGISGGAGNPEIRTTAYMANLYYDFAPSVAVRQLVPYVGVGIGAATVELDGLNLSDDEHTNFAYQVRAGLAYRIRPDLRVSVGYRFFDPGDVEFRSGAGDFDTEYNSHAVEAGLNFAF